MTKKIIIIALITGITGVVLYVIFPRESREDTTTSLADQPDIYLSGVQIQAFNTSGKLAYELRSEEIEQFSSQQKMRFSSLNIQVERENGEVWHMNAQHGSIQPELDQPTKMLEPIRLLGTVSVYSGEVENPEYSFRGEDVIYDPRANTVHSEKPSSVKAGSSTYDADAFHFDLTTKQLSLSSQPDRQVEIQYEVNGAN